MSDTTTHGRWIVTSNVRGTPYGPVTLGGADSWPTEQAADDAIVAAGHNIDDFTIEQAIARPSGPHCHPREGSASCSGCTRTICATCDAPVETDEVKTACSHYCDGCIEIEARDRGLAMERMQEWRAIRRAERISAYDARELSGGGAP